MDSGCEYDGEKFNRMVHNLRAKYDLTALDLPGLNQRIRIVQKKLLDGRIQGGKRTLLKITHSALRIELSYRKKQIYEHKNKICE